MYITGLLKEEFSVKVKNVSLHYLEKELYSLDFSVMCILLVDNFLELLFDKK